LKYYSVIRALMIEPTAYEKLWAWTRIAKGEFSCLGLVEETEEGPAITDLFLVKQESTSTTTDMNQTDIARLLVELAQDGKEGQLLAWLHSHGSNGVFWSQTDEDTIDGLAFEPYAVSVVVNKRGEARGRVDVFQPFRFTVDDLPLKVRVQPQGLDKECAREFKAKVSEGDAFGFGRQSLGRYGHVYAKQPPEALSRAFPFNPSDVDELNALLETGEITFGEYTATLYGDEGSMLLDSPFDDEPGGNHGTR
jgi:hypothetical protein